MQSRDPYQIIDERLRVGEQPTLTEIIELLKVDPVAAAVFRAGSMATIRYVIQRVNGAWPQPQSAAPPAPHGRKPG
jgi:hypothetical protein